jgi:hypothetical protein
VTAALQINSNLNTSYGVYPVQVTATNRNFPAFKASATANLGIHEILSTYKGTFYQNDNTFAVGYSDWDPGFWKGNCGPGFIAIGLSIATSGSYSKSVQCISAGSAIASGTFVAAIGGLQESRRSLRINDWDPGFYKWECGLNEYVSGFSQATSGNPLHKIRCATGNFTNGGQNSCETRRVGGGDDRGYTADGDWDPGFYKAQCSFGKAIFGVSINTTTQQPHRILCCNT